MKREKFVAWILSFLLLVGSVTAASAAEGTAVVGSAYGVEFIEKCEGQQWFSAEIERQLNMRQKSIDMLTGSADLDFIVSLGAKGAGIDGIVPEAIGELKELRTLFLGGNKLHGTLPVSLYTLPELERIDLSGNRYSGEIPGEFGTMTSLRMLNLRGNQYSGGIPATLLSNPRLTSLDVSNNQLTGGLPTELNGMASLEYLAISGNHWGGALPELSVLTGLKTLSAWGCGLSGSIPDSVYTLSQLQVLDLAGNSLTGGTSPDLGNLTQLQLLSLGSNELTGAIPSELSALTELATLDLSSNKLEGVVPDSFGGMDKLMEIHLEENKLRGHLPESVSDRLDAGTKVYARDNYLTGSVLARVEDNARNFCDGATSEQYRMTGPDSLTINETGKINVWPMVQNRHIKTGDTWLKPLLPIDCYTAEIENDPKTKVELTRDGDGFYIKVVPLPPPADPEEKPKKQEIQTAENIRLVLTLTDNTGSDFSRVSILLTTMVVSPIGGGASNNSTTPTIEEHTPYVDGYPDGRFGPEDIMTREQAAKLIVSALGAKVTAPAYNRFADVTTKRWSAPYIEYAGQMGWLLGTGGSSFSPERMMSRAEFAVCLVRVWGTKGYDVSKAITFPDVEDDSWYADYVRKASAMGLVQGMSDGKFHPIDAISRAEAVTIINRLLTRDATKVPELGTIACPFTDVVQTHWAYRDIMEASVEHQHVQTGGKGT